MLQRLRSAGFPGEPGNPAPPPRLTRDGHLDALTVVVERRGSASPDAASTAGRDLRALVKSSVGVTVDVEVVPPGAIERSVGTMRRIVDQRPTR